MSNARANKSEFDSITIENGGRGATYVETTGFTVYGHSTYGRSSVLAGQPCRQWLGHFETIEEAKSAYPTATHRTGSSFAPVSLAHLPDPEGPDPLGDNQDAYNDGLAEAYS